MARNKGTTGSRDSSSEDSGGFSEPASPTGKSPEFGKVSGSAGSTGSQGASRENDRTPSKLRGTGAGMSGEGDEESTGSGDPDAADASGNIRSDSIGGEIDSGKHSPTRGSAASANSNSGVTDPGAPGLTGSRERPRSPDSPPSSERTSGHSGGSR